MTSSFALWRDRKGQLSPLRIVTLAILVWPALLASVDGARGHLGSRTWNELIHRAGWWALVFLLISLAITPLRRASRFGRLIEVRRMIGVAAFAYAFAHLLLYVVDQRFDLVKVATEIAVRLYLTIGFVALLGLGALAATSTDAMVKRLGGLNWRRLHQIAYAIAILTLVHFFQQTKADVTVPILFAGLFVWLMGYRLLARWRGEGALTPLWLALLTVVAAILTELGDFLGIVLQAAGAPISLLLPHYLDLDFQLHPPRPAWWVLAAGLVVVLLDLVRGIAAARSGAARGGPVRGGPVRARAAGPAR